MELNKHEEAAARQKHDKLVKNLKNNQKWENGAEQWANVRLHLPLSLRADTSQE